jgi:formylglycine-generating enzyme required for sulfatase activity
MKGRKSLSLIAVIVTMPGLGGCGLAEIPTATVNSTPTPISWPQEIRAGVRFVDPMTGFCFRYVPPGSFEMGSPPEEWGRKVDENQHTVVLSRGFWMGETELTRKQWQAIDKQIPFRNTGGYDVPEGDLSFFDAIYFLNRLSRKTGLDTCYQVFDDFVIFKGPSCTGYRLPTEAEWEYAARSGGHELYSGGNDIDELGWYSSNSGEKRSQYGSTSYRAHLVARKRPNRWGLYDMSGNVWEWVWDWYGNYPSGRVTDPTGPPSGLLRVGRGGGFDYPTSRCRTANRGRDKPTRHSKGVGFRLVKTAVEK